MKLLSRAAVALLLATAACRSAPEAGPVPAAAGAPGASGPLQAVETFLSTVNQGDLQALGLVWGTAEGPARDAGFPREELEQRELIMIWCLKHDDYRIVDQLPHGEKGRAYRVDVVRGQESRTTTFYAIPGPRGRWYVENVELDPALRDFCRQR